MSHPTVSPALPSLSPGEALPIAAIVHVERGVADGLLAEFAFAQRQAGRRVRGIVQQCIGGTGKEATVLTDLDAGTRFRLFQRLGSGAASCSVDPQGVAAASSVLRRALGERPELVVVNRFGALEAAGRGFADEMLALMSEGIPLLTVVADTYRLEWQRFTGGAGSELEPDRQALDAWFAAWHPGDPR